MRSNRGDRLLLLDMLDSIGEIERNLPAQRADFDVDPRLQSHLYRHVMIVGEAAWRLSKALKDRNPEVPWGRIEGMRHLLVHDYFKVDWDILYSTTRDGIPSLKPQIQAILGSLPPGPG